MNKSLLEYFNRVEKFHWWWEGRRKLVKMLTEKENPKKILDIGCGTGETLVFIKKIFPESELYGVDLDNRAIRFAKSRGLKNIQKGNAARLNYSDKTFDLILLLDVIEHLRDDLGLLKELNRILKPGGKIIITAPAFNFIWSEHDSEQGHVRRYTAERMRNLEKESKMKLEFLSYFNFFLAFPIIVIRLIGRIPLFSSLNKFNSGLNYDLAFNKPINSLLRIIFIFEISLLRYVRYPYGISIAAKFLKN